MTRPPMLPEEAQEILDGLDWLATLITPPGGTVLDPFAGTGTTLQAARNKGFSAIGIEQEADYVELIRHRLAQSSQTTITIKENHDH